MISTTASGRFSDYSEYINLVSTDVLAPIFFKGLALLAIVGGIVYAMKRSSPALRYRVWFSGVVALLILPLLVAAIPAWNVAVLPASETTSIHTTSPTSIRGPLDTDAPLPVLAPPTESPARLSAGDVPVTDIFGDTDSSLSSKSVGVISGAIDTVVNAYRSLNVQSFHWTSWIAIVWLFGTLLNFIRIGLSHIGVRSLIRRSRLVDEDDWQLLLEETAAQLGVRKHVSLRWSHASIVPLNAGLFNPVVLLPDDASSWSRDRRQAVLLHELAHVRRHDCLTHFISQVACALHWINPFVWHASGEMVTERERAADDAVLAAGTKASAYAQTLLETANAYSSANWSAPASVAMARKSQLENRMLAILDPTKRPGELSRGNRLLATAVILLITVPLAAFSPTSAATVVSVQDAERPAPPPPQKPDLPPTPVPQTAHAPANRGHLADFVLPDIDIDDFDFDFDFDPPEVDLPDFDFELAGIDVDLPDVDFAFAPAIGGSRTFERDGIPLIVGDSLSIEQIIRLRKYGVDGDFIREIKALGFQNPTYDDLVSAAKRGAGPQYIRDMTNAGFGNLSLDEYSKAAKYGMSAAYAREMKDAGLGPLTLDELTALSRYGANPDLISGLRDAGLQNLSAEDVKRLARYGAQPDQIRKLKEMGFNSMSVDDIAGLARYGAGTDYIASMRSAGYTNLTLSEITSLSRYGVSRDLVTALSDAGYSGLTADELTSMGRYGVTKDLVSDLARAGYPNLSASDIVSLARWGVSSAYLTELKSAGYPSLTIDEVKRMKRYDVDAAFIDEIREAGLKNPTIDQLIDLRRHGVDADFIKSLRSN